MSGYSNGLIWAIIAALGLGSFLLRYSFMGFLGDRQLPAWALRYLRYTLVAVMPGLVAPLVLWPAATGGTPDPARLLAAGAALTAGVLTRNTLWAIVSGLATLYLGLWLLG
ncbi:AzlD domain-containing protein [Thioclava sp. BHET1]|uniref:Membrane protein n=1 Tax=Thioclava dalianensis TaxID=1185766 RepID=A0A074TM93_9RHOB|nr:AzlD domain-containing protein [Thioclava dalianensis]KEP71270.1 membrane protein [Thioclava dalianensis]TMV88879.1 AzlD domain-containing protein [Thioclava sp. BHET1]SFM75964.1 Branched-chain amino acid transport protein [Thioclava dalianensis]